MHPLTNLHKKAPAFPKCPVTGLPIREKPEWTDVELGENYKLTLRVLGENIILGRPEGCPVLYEQKAALNLLDEVAAGLAGEDRRYIYIVDLENARGCTRQARECYVEHMKNQPRLLGLIFISAPFMFKFFIKLAKAARRLHVNPGFTVDHEAAVQLALEMLSAGASPRDKASGAGRGGPAPPGSAPRREVVSNEEWRLQIGEYSLEAEMINGNILHSLSSGRLGVEHVEPIEALRLKVNNAPLPPGGVDYFIAGVKDLKKLDWRARRLYMESLKRWHTFQPIQMYIYYGVNPFTRAAVSLAAPFMPFRLGIADDLESALEIVENHKKNRQKGSPRAAGTAPTEEPYDAVLMNEYVDDLLDFIGRIDWEADGIGPFQGTDPLHPLTPVYEAIALVKEELDDLFRERERAESALRESEERFREILNHSRDILFKRNLETGGYEYISRAVTDIFGYTLEESGAMRFHGFVDRFHPDDKERYLQFMNTFLSAESDDETDHTVEYRLKGKDGAYRWLRNSHALVRDSAGRPRFIIGNSRDITEWKKTENALKEHHEMFLTIMDSIDAHIYVADMETFEILFMNKRMKDDLGRDLVGEPCWRALRGREGVCEECANRELLDDDGRPIDSLSREEKNPITGRWYIKKGRAIQWVDGRHVRLEIAADITRIKQLEKSRRQAEELRRHTRKLEAVGTMAEGIAHNFNNLLMAVMGNLDLVLLDLPPDSPFEDNLKSAEEAAGKAAELSTLMMTYIGQGAVRKKAIDLTEMVWEMKTSLEEGAPANAMLKFNLSPTPTPLKGDPDQIRQVISNLFTNASEAVQETGGEITLATGVRFCDQAWFSRQLLKKEAPAGEYVFFEAADTGPGMDAETIEKVSDPFFTTKFTGRGLGMAAVAGIVRGHKGAISLESEPGEGAIVRALFPALQERLPGAAPKKIDAPAETLRGSGTVLLVDDEEIVLTVGKAMLEKLGFHVLTAKDGLEAVEVFRERSNDIRFVVLDITMPHMDGGEAFREMKRIDPGVRALISSGFTEGRMEEQFENAPPAGFIHKPFKLKDFSRKIREVIDQKQDRTNRKTEGAGKTVQTI